MIATVVLYNSHIKSPFNVLPVSIAFVSYSLMSECSKYHLPADRVSICNPHIGGAPPPPQGATATRASAPSILNLSPRSQRRQTSLPHYPTWMVCHDPKKVLLPTPQNVEYETNSLQVPYSDRTTFGGRIWVSTSDLKAITTGRQRALLDTSGGERGLPKCEPEEEDGDTATSLACSVGPSATLDSRLHTATSLACSVGPSATLDSRLHTATSLACSVGPSATLEDSLSSINIVKIPLARSVGPSAALDGLQPPTHRSVTCAKRWQQKRAQWRVRTCWEVNGRGERARDDCIPGASRQL